MARSHVTPNQGKAQSITPTTRSQGKPQQVPKQRPVVVSCIQPTSEMHIGNYFGAITNWVRLQATHTCIYGVADLHAMTMPYAPAQLRAFTERMVVDLLTCGIDPEQATIFIQSLVPEHTELCWLLQCVCPYDTLAQMTQFQDKASLLKEAGQFVSAGLFTYPILQATDMLMYHAAFTPVGKDQAQHLELAQTIAQHFNYRFGTYFPIPQPLFTETPRIMSLSDPERKMSKSQGPHSYIGLFEDAASIRAKVKAAVTDVGILPKGVVMSAGIANLFTILDACGHGTDAASLRQDYAAGNLRYPVLKEAVADALVTLTQGLRARRQDVLAQMPDQSRRIAHLSEQAREIARTTLRAVRAVVGLPERSS